jgi:carbon starvation protein CstA
MVTFFLAIAALLAGYWFYSRFVERVFGMKDELATPAKRLHDGVDFVELDWKRAFLIQFLNIAGLGPIFGAVAGALWGPVAFLWIVLGAIFAGATHDYLSGMMSVRHDGETMGELVGRYLGVPAKQVMRFFTVILMVLVGAVFITGPADILQSMTGIGKPIIFAVIVLYYLLATVLPIDKLIGRIYPIFGAALLFMGLGILGGIIVKGYTLPELTLHNLHPQGRSIFPFLFITIACGAISGFHSTQSPLMARCIRREREGRRVFYGAMISEAVIAMIWAAGAMAFFGSTGKLAAAGPAALVVKTMSRELLGLVGGFLAIFGVVAAPITSGDTAFRSARLIIADAFSIRQERLRNRFFIAIPLFAAGIALCFIDFAIIWRYFAWSNQTLGAIMLWTAAVYLRCHGRWHWLATLPAVFMTVVVTSYILVAPEGLKLPMALGLPIGLAVALFCLGLFLLRKGQRAGVDPA